MAALIFALLSVLLWTAEGQTISMQHGNGTLEITFKITDFEIIYEFNIRDRLKGRLGVGMGIEASDITDCVGVPNCLQIGTDVRLRATEKFDSGFEILWSTDNVQTIFKDCFDLDSANTNWYGGPERYEQLWPIEKLTLNNFANVPQEAGFSAITEPYWLNSKGGYVYVDQKVPLFIDQNTDDKDEVCFVAKLESPYRGRNEVLLNYTIEAEGDAKQAHMLAVNHFLGKPKANPHRGMMIDPIWSTWARYKQNIDDQTVLDYGRAIASYNYTGQIEIDDRWETCYGSLTFDPVKFGDINNTIAQLKQLGFRVTLWVHPFVNDDCTEYTNIGISNGFFVTNETGSQLTSWWNSGPYEARYVDFTNPEARDWFVSRLELLRTKHGIDGFKFDAGETTWAPSGPVLNGDIDLMPTQLTKDYVNTAVRLGDLTEIRTGYGTQSLPPFVRMLDKDTRWGTDNGLYTLITTLLQMNMNGYSIVLPDMIGGNAYDIPPDAELFVRWLQANTFMPGIQFSFPPWHYINVFSFDVIAISKKFVDLRTQYFEYIELQFQYNINLGLPVNPPIWWMDPKDEDSLKVDTQFMVGDELLVAPVIEKGGESRTVYLPAGSWIDGETGTVFDGRQRIEYDAPIDVLPYFIRQHSKIDKWTKQ